jgi:hypothetical protein
MVEAKLDNFRHFNWNIVDLPTIKEIIYDFWVSNARSVLHGKHISLDFPTIIQIFKLLTKGIALPALEAYNEEWSEYFERGKNEHYKHDSRYILPKMCNSRMQMQLRTLAKVATFRQGNHYILRTLLSTISAIERGTVNWAEWFNVRLHKEMITV